MKKSLFSVMAVPLLAFGVAFVPPASAEGEAKPKKEFSEKQMAQQQRMRDCNAEAKVNELKGEARKAFMKTCLSGGEVTTEAGDATATAGASPQREKMKRCNAEAKAQSLTGDARKAFMSTCLSGS